MVYLPILYNFIRYLTLYILASLQEAKVKARKAEYTSDLSTSEDISKTRYKKIKVQDAPLFTDSLNKGKFVVIKLLSIAIILMLIIV